MSDQRTEKAKEKLRKKIGKKIVIYGDSCDRSSGNAKLIYYMAKAFQQRGHNVYTIGMEYSGPQTSHDDIPILPGFHCEVCGSKGGNQQVYKIAQWIKLLQTEYFICVGDPIKFQEFGIGNLTLEKSEVKTIMYGTLDSEGKWCDERLKFGKRDFIEICDKVVATSIYSQKQFKEWYNLDTEMIHETVDFDNYVPVSAERKKELRQEHRFKEDDFVMYYSGRNNLRKRLFTLIEACTKLLCESDNTYLYLNVPPMNRNEPGKPAIYPDTINPMDFVKRVMKKLYGRDLHEEGRIVFVERDELGSSRITEKDNAKYYQIADVFVTCTSAEGFSLCPVESIGCGVPVISPDSNTGKEVIGGTGKEDPARPGFKFAEGGLLTNCPINQWQGYSLRQRITTAENTYKALKFMYESKEPRERMAEQGREYALKMFNYDMFKEKWNEVIKTTEKKKVEEEFKSLEIEKEENTNGESKSKS